VVELEVEGRDCNGSGDSSALGLEDGHDGVG
jgi:hypothetical protein